MQVHVIIGISENAMKWLGEERHIVGIGIDTPSVDQGSDEVRLSHFSCHINLIFQTIIHFLLQRYPVHLYAGPKQIYNLENVANLHLIPAASHIKLFVLPLKITGGTGAPARILAAVKE